MFMNLAHRGASGYAPENTLPAFYKGLELGANGIELDLQTTKDGYIVLFHDETIDKKSNAMGKIKDYTLEELQKIDFGSWYSHIYKNEPIVLLADFLKLFGKRDLYLAIEIKFINNYIKLVEMVKKYMNTSKITITSFELEDLKNIREFNNSISLGYLTENFSENICRELLKLNIKQICPIITELTHEKMIMARSLGLSVRSWGITTKKDMFKALKYNVDGITVNSPDKLQKALVKKMSK